MSRTYVNNVNITNTTVNITKVTNVYNTVIINQNTTVHNVTYINQHVHNGVTVVDRETFVNARPVANHVMRVDTREVASAPVSHVVSAEPVRTSVMGAGRPVAAKPPVAVISRPVVAVRTPPAPPRPIEQRQTEARGHLNEQQLVRPVGPSQPVQANQGARTQPAQPGFRPFGQPNPPTASSNSQVKPMLKPQPRVYEQQGTPEPENGGMRANENRNPGPPQTRSAQPPNQGFRPSPQPERSFPQETHPLVRPTPPVQEHNQQQEERQAEKFHTWQQQRPAQPPPQRQQPSRPEPQRQEKPKGR